VDTFREVAVLLADFRWKSNDHTCIALVASIGFETTRSAKLTYSENSLRWIPGWARRTS